MRRVGIMMVVKESVKKRLKTNSDKLFITVLAPDFHVSHI